MLSTTGEILERMRLQMTNKEEEYLAQLPSGTPISWGIFGMGFYIQDGLIKYRASLLSTIRSSKGCLAELMLMFCFAIGVFCLWMGAFYYAAACFFLALGEKIGYEIKYSLSPPFGFDVEKRVLRHGQIFVKDIPFENIDYIHVRENYIFMGGIGLETYVYINYTAVYADFTADRHFLIMRFHMNEKRFADLFVEGLKVILNREYAVKREVWGNKDKIQY
jgi:hypothetical protein